MDELIQASVAQLGKLIYDISKSFSGDIKELINKKINNNKNYFHEISTKYLINFFNRYGHIQVLGMSKPMHLNNIFIDIQMLDCIGNDKYASVKKLMESFKESIDSNRSLQVIENKKSDGINTAERENRLMVLGAPGGGKSTYLKKIGFESLKGKNPILKKYLPILIELKNIDIGKNINTLIVKELEIANFPNPQEYLEKSLHKGKILLLFDGLDEIPQDLETKTLNDIRDFCDKYSNNKFVVSCRLAAYKGGLNNFTNIEIANFDKKQIENFIKKWFKEKSKENRNFKDISEECWKKISSPDMQATMELAQSPLMLTLLCLVYNYQQDFPSNRSLLYKEAIDVQLKEWNASKRIHNNPIYKDMTLPFEELLLSRIAYLYFIKDEYFFNKTDLANQISEFISNNLNAPKFLDGTDILETISIQQGILLERAKNIYSFSHLTFQEYFAAKYIDDYGLLNEIIDKQLDNSKWREIFILLSGIMKTGSDKLLNAISVKSRKSIEKETNFKKLIQRIDNSQERSLQNKFTDLLLILIFCSNIDKYQCVAILTRLINNIDRELGYLIDFSWIVDKKVDVKHHLISYIELLDSLELESSISRNVNKVLKQFQIDDSLDVTKEILKSLEIEYFTFTPEGMNNISNFFQNLGFLIHCKKASIIVTKDNWNKIEHEILNIN
ncbi:NACHT domain-containing protein [Winogradskyella helgolandensis]|uniref:NACHT domain-containing protein n=1 Tax=Winogradskyella helgolandensis TaxID=2697010 RepID=UPI0015CC3355|nr:NACHT domain-containing protein [Winogradskyella helgolandensis]